MNDQYERIKSQYYDAQGDSTNLFKEILIAADEIGLDQAFAYLEDCVIEKRIAWIKQNLDEVKDTKRPVWDGYRLFYEVYLGVYTPEDGKIIEQSDHKIVSRWWNPCPTLDACEKLGLDTREICKKTYHKPVQEFLVQIHPNLRFERNYACIRPYAPYCEEIIYLEA
jgi:hypothetical protein